MSNGHAATFTGDNIDEIRDLGVHVMQHSTQAAIIVFANDGDLDPIGVAVAGQVIQAGKDGVRILGAAPDVPAPGEDPVPGGEALFDPSEHSVDEVQEYLASVADTPDEVERVLAVEAAGKNRKSLVGTGE